MEQAYDSLPKAESLRLLPDEPDRAVYQFNVVRREARLHLGNCFFYERDNLDAGHSGPAVLLHGGAQSRPGMQGEIELGVRHCHGWTGARPGRDVRSLGAFYYAG